ncbi:hypothetical protein [Mesoflavibacter zeaxanthinifaciens]|uniref:hypothetical protein n=1 Tax=Mesoflavibacter zeaxanthinifaciens TaxID=393060 RepID=UPI0003FA1F5A|nr:hypothetical protein [Mesoflavibacter zeaxanthinifaciens]
MKLTQSILLLFLSLFLFNCSDDSDDSEINNQIQFSGEFLPLSIDNQWNYDIENTNNNTNETTNSQDVLKVESENASGFSLSVNDNGVANGTMSGILTTGDLSLTETTLVSNGTIGLPIDGFDFNIVLENALLYNTEAPNGEILYTQSGTFAQDFQGYPITINYSLFSTQLENLENLEVLGANFDTVTSANISLELSVSTEVSVFGLTQTISLLDTQNVLSVDAFYAKDIGLITANANIGYSLNENTVTILQQLGVDLSMLPTSTSILNTQELTSYTLQ